MAKHNLYLYPITPYTFQKGSNDYILKVKDGLSQHFTIINKPTTLGVVDILLKLPKCKVLYLNWIEDIVDKRMGYLQVPILFFILLWCSLTGKKVIWFIHNNLSHSRKNWQAKKLVRRMMMLFSDKILSHAEAPEMGAAKKSVQFFDHPVANYEHVNVQSSAEYDILIWGTVSPYKGVHEFVQFTAQTKKLANFKIAIAGRFASPELFESIKAIAPPNITLINRVFEEEELKSIMANSRYVLFCYNSSSVLSSGALCKTLSYGKTIIGPERGCFKELGEKGLILTYENFDQLSDILTELIVKEQYISEELIQRYVQKTSWDDFHEFLVHQLKPSYAPLPVNNKEVVVKI